MKKVEKRLKRPPRKSSDRTYQFHICLWIALRKTTPQIRALLKDRFDIDMSSQGVDHTYRYGKRWKPVINYLRKRYLDNISRIPIANKAYRLQSLQEALEEALTWHTKSVSQWGVVKEKKIGSVPVIIKEARVEIEGEKPLIDKSRHYYLFKDIKDNGRPLGEFIRDFVGKLSEANRR